MTSGMLFALAISALVIAVLVGLMRRQRTAGAGKRLARRPGHRRAMDRRRDDAPAVERRASRSLSAASALPVQGRERRLPAAQGGVSAARDLRARAAGRRAAGQDRAAGHGTPARVSQDRQPARRLRRLRSRHDHRRHRRRARSPSRCRIRATRSSRSSSSAACRRRRSSTSASIPPTLPRYRELREQILGPAAELV